MSQYIENLNWPSLLWPLATLLIGVICYKLLQLFFSKREKTSTNAPLQRQVSNFVFILLFVITFVLVLPIKDSLQGQIIGLIGILLSASIALSSTTFLGNIMAGIWLRSVKNFRVGDFVELKDQFGRVSARGLLHIEIQNRERDLITIPNLYLVTQPVTVMHNDGTIISTEISLGYDVDHSIVEPVLLNAAEQSGLENPFVYIESLGDFSIVYKIHGLAKELTAMLSARSKLNTAVLDALHAAKIEIVSPNFMNQRQVADQTFIPTSRATKTQESSKPEDVIFDKAEKAEKLDDMKKRHRELVEEIENLKITIKASENGNEKSQLEKELSNLEKREQRITSYLEVKDEELRLEGKDK